MSGRWPAAAYRTYLDKGRRPALWTFFVNGAIVPCREVIWCYWGGFELILQSLGVPEYGLKMVIIWNISRRKLENFEGNNVKILRL